MSEMKKALRYWLCVYGALFITVFALHYVVDPAAKHMTVPALLLLGAMRLMSKRVAPTAGADHE